MLFNSWQFVLFFPIVTLLYFVLPFRFRTILLLLAGAVFYMVFIPRYIFILITLIIIDYFAGILIAKSKKTKRGLFLTISLISNLGFLGFFKYFNFFSANLNALFNWLGVGYATPLLEIILPIGLSFHTFQAMAYTIEVYRGKIKPEKKILTYALYVVFYPQLVAGPIERPQNLLPQIKVRHSFNYDNAVSGLRLMAWGLFKKMFIADRLAVAVNYIYNQPTLFHGPVLFMATFYFAVQIYCDFSAYSDIAIGAARVMGIKLMVNFRHPYLAKDIGDFWQRWHISLSSWFRDYVYIPIGGSRYGINRFIIAILAVFLLSGLWHGANWTFIIWGALHASYYLLGRFISRPMVLLENILSGLGLKIFSAIKILTTFVIVTYAWIFFRANNLFDARYIALDIFRGWGGYFRYFWESLPLVLSGQANKLLLYQLYLPLKMDMPELEFMMLVIGLLILLVFEYLDRRDNFWERFSRLPLTARWFVYIVIVLLIINFGAMKPSKFIYFQF